MSRPRLPLATSVAQLAPRQREVVARYGQGMNVGQIAKDLNIAYGTANKHLELACDRLGCKARRELMRFAGAQQQGATG
jgi:DNA-binding CsgD family transcriptional regulator